MNIFIRISYYFCILFGIVRCRYYLVYPDGCIEKTYIRQFPNIMYNRKKNEYYLVSNVVSEIVNKTMIYYYIKLEKYV